MAHLLEQLGLLIQDFISALGYPGLSLVMFAENVFPPIPSEAVMPFSGFLVATKPGQFTFLGIMVASVLGSVVGALFLYYVGVWADERIIRGFIRRYGRYLTITENELDRALRLFGQYGGIIIFVGRLIPIIRSIISIPAGINRMPLPRFLFYTVLGTSIWNGVLGYAGFVLGENWSRVIDLVGTYQNITLVIMGGVFVVGVFFWIRRQRTVPISLD